MNNRILKILGISDADENNDALSNRIRKKLEEAENHPVDAGKSLYEYDRNGETVLPELKNLQMNRVRPGALRTFPSGGMRSIA